MASTLNQSQSDWDNQLIKCYQEVSSKPISRENRLTYLLYHYSNVFKWNNKNVVTLSDGTRFVGDSNVNGITFANDKDAVAYKVLTWLEKKAGESGGSSANEQLSSEDSTRANGSVNGHSTNGSTNGHSMGQSSANLTSSTGPSNATSSAKNLNQALADCFESILPMTEADATSLQLLDFLLTNHSNLIKQTKGDPFPEVTIGGVSKFVCTGPLKKGVKSRMEVIALKVLKYLNMKYNKVQSKSSNYGEEDCSQGVAGQVAETCRQNGSNVQQQANGSFNCQSMSQPSLLSKASNIAGSTTEPVSAASSSTRSLSRTSNHDQNLFLPAVSSSPTTAPSHQVQQLVHLLDAYHSLTTEFASMNQKKAEIVDLLRLKRVPFEVSEWSAICPEENVVMYHRKVTLGVIFFSFQGTKAIDLVRRTGNALLRFIETLEHLVKLVKDAVSAESNPSAILHNLEQQCQQPNSHIKMFNQPIANHMDIHVTPTGDLVINANMQKEDEMVNELKALAKLSHTGPSSPVASNQPRVSAGGQSNEPIESAKLINSSGPSSGTFEPVLPNFNASTSKSPTASPTKKNLDKILADCYQSVTSLPMTREEKLDYLVAKYPTIFKLTSIPSAQGGEPIPTFTILRSGSKFTCHQVDAGKGFTSRKDVVGQKVLKFLFHKSSMFYGCFVAGGENKPTDQAVANRNAPPNVESRSRNGSTNGHKMSDQQQQKQATSSTKQTTSPKSTIPKTIATSGDSVPSASPKVKEAGNVLKTGSNTANVKPTEAKPNTSTQSNGSTNGHKMSEQQQNQATSSTKQTTNTSTQSNGSTNGHKISEQQKQATSSTKRTTNTSTQSNGSTNGHKMSEQQNQATSSTKRTTNTSTQSNGSTNGHKMSEQQKQATSSTKQTTNTSTQSNGGSSIGQSLAELNLNGSTSDPGAGINAAGITSDNELDRTLVKCYLKALVQSCSREANLAWLLENYPDLFALSFKDSPQGTQVLEVTITGTGAVFSCTVEEVKDNEDRSPTEVVGRKLMNYLKEKWVKSGSTGAQNKSPSVVEKPPTPSPIQSPTSKAGQNPIPEPAENLGQKLAQSPVQKPVQNLALTPPVDKNQNADTKIKPTSDEFSNTLDMMANLLKTPPGASSNGSSPSPINSPVTESEPPQTSSGSFKSSSAESPLQQPAIPPSKSLYHDMEKIAKRIQLLKDFELVNIPNTRSAISIMADLKKKSKNPITETTARITSTKIQTRFQIKEIGVFDGVGDTYADSHENAAVKAVNFIKGVAKLVQCFKEVYTPTKPKDKVVQELIAQNDIIHLTPNKPIKDGRRTVDTFNIAIISLFSIIHKPKAELNDMLIDYLKHLSQVG